MLIIKVGSDESSLEDVMIAGLMEVDTMEDSKVLGPANAQVPSVDMQPAIGRSPGDP